MTFVKTDNEILSAGYLKTIWAMALKLDALIGMKSRLPECRITFEKKKNPIISGAIFLIYNDNEILSAGYLENYLNNGLETWYASWG